MFFLHLGMIDQNVQRGFQTWRVCSVLLLTLVDFLDEEVYDGLENSFSGSLDMAVLSNNS